MTKHSMSLLDVLIPPGNRWLASLPRSSADLPPGVRVVRFGENDDEGLEATESAGVGYGRKSLAEA